MKKLFPYALLMLLACVTNVQAKKSDSLTNAQKKKYKAYENNDVKQSRKNKAQQKKKETTKASSMMDTLGDKLNSHKNDK